MGQGGLGGSLKERRANRRSRPPPSLARNLAETWQQSQSECKPSHSHSNWCVQSHAKKLHRLLLHQEAVCCQSCPRTFVHPYSNSSAAARNGKQSSVASRSEVRRVPSAVTATQLLVACGQSRVTQRAAVQCSAHSTLGSDSYATANDISELRAKQIACLLTRWLLCAKGKQFRHWR